MSDDEADTVSAESICGRIDSAGYAAHDAAQKFAQYYTNLRVCALSLNGEIPNRILRLPSCNSKKSSGHVIQFIQRNRAIAEVA
jgi:hypothetical protein